MALARKCDICGEYYDCEKGMSIEIWEGPIHGSSDQTYELCPSHSNMVRRLLNGNDTVSFYKTEEA